MADEENWIDRTLARAKNVPVVGRVADRIAYRRESRRQEAAFSESADQGFSTHTRNQQMREWRKALEPTEKDYVADLKQQHAAVAYLDGNNRMDDDPPTRTQAAQPGDVKRQQEAIVAKQTEPTHPRENTLAQIREVQKILRKAETSASYYGDPSDPIENIGPWDRAGRVIAALSQNPKAAPILGEQGITFKNGWLHGPDGVSIRSYQLNPFTVTPDLPREVRVQGAYGRPNFQLTTDVLDLPGLGDEYRFQAVLRRDGKIMHERTTRNYSSLEEALRMAPVLLRDRIDDYHYTVIPDDAKRPVRAEVFRESDAASEQAMQLRQSEQPSKPNLRQSQFPQLRP